jgi:trehalose 6-phosphate synthase
MKVLFVCEYNACRSQMGEGLGRHLFPKSWTISSAGLYQGEVNKLTIQVMGEIGIDISSHRSKTLDDLGETHFDLLILLAEPGLERTKQISATRRIYWPLPDPLKGAGDEKALMEATRIVRDSLKRKIADLQGLPDLWSSDRLKAYAVERLGGRNLIMVSNREPYVHIKEAGQRKVIVPASGLVTALDPVLRATGGLWIAHGSGAADREITNSEDKIQVPPDSPAYTLKRVWLTKDEEEGYYYGFANQALWPLCHLTHYRPVFDEGQWALYRQANQKFADAVIRECRQDRPFILIHDYHFTLLPRLIREKCPEAVIGLFWHIPWPTPEVFQICPWKREIVEGMLGADFIGFHVRSYCDNFLETARQLLPVDIHPDSMTVHHARGASRVKPLPISIQPWEERGIPSDADYRENARSWRERLELPEEVRVVVSVDRLDYTKGIPERLRAIDRFFEKHPQYLKKVSFVQLVAPSKIHIPGYREFITEIEKIVDQANWKHGINGWKPIILLKNHHDAPTVYTFMRMADVCIVSSLADGMNLVAKEFVAARGGEDGVLVLSQFTGAAQELRDALLVNPYSLFEFVDVIRSALEMPSEEQKRRMTRLKRQVAQNNVYRWAADLIQEMTR